LTTSSGKCWRSPGGELLRRNVVLRTELDSGGRSVLGDRVQLQQVLLNLIMNGIEAMNGGDSRR
jgi:signal transduction histidine kinase